MPGAVGVNVFTPPVVPLCSKVPPTAALYQSTVKPAGTVAETDDIVPPIQYEVLTGIVGAAITGQLQFGAVIESVFTQVDVKVRMISVPAIIPLIVQLFKLGLVTVPAVLVTVPALTVTETE